MKEIHAEFLSRSKIFRWVLFMVDIHGEDPLCDPVFSWKKLARDWEAHRRAIGTKFPPPTPGPPASALVLFALKGKQDQVRRGGL